MTHGRKSEFVRTGQFRHSERLADDSRPDRYPEVSIKITLDYAALLSGIGIFTDPKAVL